MLFNTLQYAIFLTFVVAAVRACPSRYRCAVLLTASLIFYALWLPAYLLLLLLDLWVNYALLKAMIRSERPKVYLAVSIAFTLMLLAGFKYAALVVGTIAPLLASDLDPTSVMPRIVLPLGISFYSFQIIALSVDTYRRRIEPVESFARYALFISFFPQLIAGPILRGAEMLPQLATGGRPSSARTRRGFWLLVSGLVKKVVFADVLLAPFVDQAFSAPDIGSAAYHLVVAYSFAFQIYFDFSGYVDMARGSALLLGFELPTNFLEPYLSRNPAEFWRRWHITLSTWLRDYLYIPLGGNRGGEIRTYANLLATMLLGGLWHGASWTFVAWGGIHGVVLMLHRRFSGNAGDIERPISTRDIPAIVLTFHIAAGAFAVFRAPTFSDAALFFSGFASLDLLSGWPPVQTAVVLLCVVAHCLERWLRTRLAGVRRVAEENLWGVVVEGAVAGALVGLAYTLSGIGGEFIYFQF